MIKSWCHSKGKLGCENERTYRASPSLASLTALRSLRKSRELGLRTLEALALLFLLLQVCRFKTAGFLIKVLAFSLLARLVWHTAQCGAGSFPGTN